ncbi:MAG: NAD-dependent succinate-semialdehyde dehydrogenase [Verrucomicrobia bacterium]|nr:NAD-dependent succinate-semialdehyde dehydrogenase [Verrucomicrobiota bacterium]
MKTHPLYLDGEFVTTDTSLPVTNPATGEVFASICTVGRGRVALAVRDAHAAFQSWRQTNCRHRADLLLKLAAEVERRKDDIARAITLENGKPLVQSYAETAMTADHLRWFGEEARRAYGRIIPNNVDGKRHLVVKTPLGVVAAISPWNFPLVLAVRKVAPALAAGCTVLLKPASSTPVSCAAFAECVHAAGLPRGVFQLVAGSASEIGAEFLENPLVRKITFTGSTEVGKRLIEGAARLVKPLSLELGGCAPLIVFDDADLDRAVECTLIAKFRNTGQTCIAANRIYAHRGVCAGFIDRLVARVAAMKVGDGLEPGVEIGPLINEAALKSALGQIEDAVGRGARLLCGGTRVARGRGNFFAPAVLADVPDASACMIEETFAPIAPVSVFDTEGEVIARANATPYGLCAYAFTRDIGRTFRLAEQLEAGMIAINDAVPTASHCPFGGVKQSGWGRELGSEGLDAFLDTKHVSLGL